MPNTTNEPLDYERGIDVEYDYAEIQVCVTRPDTGAGTNVEALGDDCETVAIAEVAAGEASDWFYSVYWHLTVGGVRCVADFHNDDRIGAERLYAALMCAVAVQRGHDQTAQSYARTACGFKLPQSTLF